MPVSSSAQLTLVPWLLGWPVAPDRTTFAAALHAGSCVGIGWALRGELQALDRRTLVLLAATSVPAALAGLLAADAVEARLGRPGPTSLLSAAAGLALLVADRRGSRAGTDVGPREAAVAALAQVAALAPGVSRSGATLTALRLLGVDRPVAQRFSLLMSLPVTAGAAGLTLSRGRRTVPVGDLLLGVPASAVAAGLVARRHVLPVGGAAVYRLALAAAVAVRLRSSGRELS